MMWVRVVLCPDCKALKEVDLKQKRWKCPECKKKHDVMATLWRSVKKDGV